MKIKDNSNINLIINNNIDCLSLKDNKDTNIGILNHLRHRKRKTDSDDSFNNGFKKKIFWEKEKNNLS